MRALYYITRAYVRTLLFETTWSNGGGGGRVCCVCVRSAVRMLSVQKRLCASLGLGGRRGAKVRGEQMVFFFSISLSLSLSLRENDNNNIIIIRRDYRRIRARRRSGRARSTATSRRNVVRARVGPVREPYSRRFFLFFFFFVRFFDVLVFRVEFRGEKKTLVKIPSRGVSAGHHHSVYNNIL